MSDLLLWKVLTITDHKAMHAQAKHSSSGGGAMHIALGVDSAAFPIKDFLNTNRSRKTVQTEASSKRFPAGSLVFAINPARGNEWRIADQAHSRHPALTAAQGFPAVYDPQDRPVIFVARCKGKYYPRFALENALSQMDAGLAAAIAGKTKGIALFSAAWAKAFGIADVDTNLSRYQEALHTALRQHATPFVPDSLEDARKRIVREIVRRQGQQSFRKKLLRSYGGRCAISGCDIEEALEAAHISPYRGEHTNHVANGILLRADLHTLFDLGLMTVTPIEHKVLVSSRLRPPHYQALTGVKITEPAEGVSDAALEEHGKLFIL